MYILIAFENINSVVNLLYIKTRGIFMGKKVTAVFAALLVSSGIITTFAVANDKSSAYNEKETKDISAVVQTENSKVNDFNYTQLLNEISGSSQAEKIMIKEIPVEQLTPETKQDYYHKMLNAIDYYNTVSGSFKTNYLGNNNTEETVVSYQVDMINNNCYEHMSNEANDSEVYVGDEKIIDINNISKSKRKSPIYFTKVSELAGYNDSVLQVKNDVEQARKRLNEKFADENRVTVDENGDTHCLNRLNSTNLCISASYSLLPQGLTFGYLSNQDMWEISGDTEYLGRNAVVIKGTAGDYGKKFNTSTFEMIVDKETGILLELQGYDENGNPSEYIKTTEISFEQPDVKVYSPNEYKDYKELAK